MRLTFPKIIVAILLGIVFLLGGADMVSAAAPVPLNPAGDDLLSKISCGSWDECIPKLPEMMFMYLSYVIYILTAGILTLAGYLFDAVLTLSIDVTFIQKPFIDSVWTIIRDFSNMLFIFVLIYAGVQTILGMGNWRSTVLKVVVVALLINFSLFFTKVVIDAGNVLAVGIYEAIGVVKTEKIHTQGTGLQERDLSAALVKSFKPERFLNPNIKTISPALGFMLFILGAAVNLLAAWAFFRVALMFVGRIIGFWFLMVVSPFAFISTTFPKGDMFHSWLKNLLGLSFVAPVFLFFLYLIMKVLSPAGGIFSSIANPDPSSFATFSFDVFFLPIVMVIFIYMALDKAVSFSKDMAGSFGDLGAKLGGAVMGVAGGVALGGAALGLRKVVGGYAAGSLQRGVKTESELAAMSGGERAKYQSSRARMQTLTKSSFDVRNLGGKDSIFGATIGGALAKGVSGGVGAFGISTAGGGAGGVEKEAKDKEKKLIDNVPKLGIFEEQEISRRAGREAEANKKELEEAQKAYEDSLEAQQVIAAKTASESAKTTAEEAKRKVEEAQKAYDAMRNSGARDPKITQALADTEKEQRQALAALSAADATLAKAIADDAGSATTAVLKAAKGKELDAKKLAETDIKAENDRRREHYADKVEEFGVTAPLAKWRKEKNTHTANKIRKGEESGNAKKLKELAKDKKKEEEGANRPDVIKHIEEKIEETKGNK